MKAAGTKLLKTIISKKKNEDFLKEKIDVTKYKTILTEEDLNKWINILKTQSLIAVDTETSSLNPVEADLVGALSLLL